MEEQYVIHEDNPYARHLETVVAELTRTCAAQSTSLVNDFRRVAQLGQELLNERRDLANAKKANRELKTINQDQAEVITAYLIHNGEMCNLLDTKSKEIVRLNDLVKEMQAYVNENGAVAHTENELKNTIRNQRNHIKGLETDLMNSREIAADLQGRLNQWRKANCVRPHTHESEGESSPRTRRSFSEGRQ